MEGCPEGWSRQGNFLILTECIVPELVGQILDIATLCCISILLITMLIILLQMGGFREKPLFNRTLISLTIIQVFLMTTRPILALLGFFPSNPWIGEIIHGVAALIANIPIGFMYLELRILLHSSIKRRSDDLQPIRAALGSLDVIQFILFLLGPPIVYLLQIDPHIAFWIPVIFVDFTAIPLFCYFGFSIYRRIRQLRNEDYRKFSKKIIISISVCGVLGLTTGVVGIIAILFRELDWVFLRACWIAAIIFDGIIFNSLMSKN